MSSQPSPDTENLWIVTPGNEVDSEGRVAVIVPAHTEAQAVSLGADWLTEHPDFADALPITHLFAAPWSNRTAYVIRCAAEVAELQCCGGGAHAEFVGLDGHWGGCPEAPKREAPDA